MAAHLSPFRPVVAICTILFCLLLPTALRAQTCVQGDAPVDLITRDWARTCTHPLCGFVLQTSKPVPPDWLSCRHESWRPLIYAMFEISRAGGITALGEVHDNGEHHRLRAQLIEMNDAAVFEQVRADQQPAFNDFMALVEAASPTATTDELLRLLAWDKTAWSKTADYRPLFDAAVTGKVALYAGDPPRDLIRKVAKEGLDAAVPTEEQKRLALDVPLGTANDAASLAEIETSHCGMIPKAAHANMAAAQRYRDAHLADTLLKAARDNGTAILFAGNGHVRTDRGAPWYLRSRRPDKPVIAVVLVEVVDGKTDPQAYVPRDAEGRPAADFVIFTPPGPDRDKDPCDAFKKQPAPQSGAAKP